MIGRMVFAGLILLLGFGILPARAQDTETPPTLPKTFCMGQIQFNYPLNWAIDTEYADGTPSAELIYASNSASEFAGGFFTPNPAQGNVIVFVGALNASYIAQNYGVEADSPEKVLKGIFDSMPSFDRPQTSAIQSFDLNGHPAARADLHDATTEGAALVVQYGDDQFGLLRFVTPLDEASHWESTVLAIFETVNIAKSAPCFTAPDKTFSAQDATPEVTETMFHNARDYCAGELSYTLPEGWSAAEVAHTQFGASVHIASSKAALESDTARKGEAVVIVSIIGRSALAQFLDIDPKADVVSILKGIASPVSMPVKADSITSIKLGEQNAARMDVHFDTNDLLMIALDVQPDLIGLVALATPEDEIDQWQNTAIEVAGSVRFDLPSTVNTDIPGCSA